MPLLDQIPRALRGRGGKEVHPFKCECGESYIWPRNKGRVSVCPTCRQMNDLAANDEAFSAIKPLDGSKA